MHQMELVRKSERIFHEDIEALKNRKIPLGTNQRIVRPKKKRKSHYKRIADEISFGDRNVVVSR